MVNAVRAVASVGVGVESEEALVEKLRDSGGEGLELFLAADELRLLGGTTPPFGEPSLAAVRSEGRRVALELYRIDDRLIHGQVVVPKSN